MGTPVMLRLRPQQTVLSGLGVAGAVLAAVVVTFALASGIIAYRITTEAPLVPSTSALVLDPLRAGARTAEPLVLRRTGQTAAGTRTLVRGGAVTGASTRGSANASLTTARGGLATDIAPQAGGLGTSGGSDETAQPGGGGRGSVGAVLEQTTQVVGATTGSVGRRLQGITGELDTRTREHVSTVLRRTAAAVARLLAGPPEG
jgi:hypothetical protein